MFQLILTLFFLLSLCTACTVANSPGRGRTQQIKTGTAWASTIINHQLSMHKVSTPSAEMAGSWWFQHVPTDSNCQGRSILLHWNLLKKERLLPGWRRGKRVHVFEKQWETHDLDHLDHSHRRQIIPRSASGEHRWLSRWSHKVGVNAPHVDGTQMTCPEHDVCQCMYSLCIHTFIIFYWDMKELQMCG